MPQLIVGNPTLDAYNQTRTRLGQIYAQDAQRQTAEQQREDAEVKRIQAENLDRRLGAEFAQVPAAAAPVTATPTAPAAQTIATSPVASPASPAAVVGGQAAPTAAPATTGFRSLRPPSVAERAGRVMLQSPGFRSQGVTVLQTDQQRQEKLEADATVKFLDLAAKNPQMAYAFAQQNGLPVPQGYLEALAQTGLNQTLDRKEKQLRAVYAIGTAQADNAGYNNAMTALNQSLVTQMRAFVQQRQAQTQSGGATPASAAPAQPAAPTTLPSFDTSGVSLPAPQLREKPTIIYGTTGTYAYTDRGGAKPITAEGQPIVRQAGTGASRLVQIVGEDGNPVWVTQAEAVGKQAFVKPTAQTRKLVQVTGPDGKPVWAYADQAVGQEAYQRGFAPQKIQYRPGRQNGIVGAWRIDPNVPGGETFIEGMDLNRPDARLYKTVDAEGNIIWQERESAIGAQAPQTTTGKESVFQQKYNLHLQTYGNDKEALKYASGRSEVSPQQEAKWAHGMAVQEARNSITARVDPGFIARRQQEILAEWRQRAQPTPAAGPGQIYTDPQTGTTGTFTGRYNNGSPVYRTQDGREFAVE